MTSRKLVTRDEILTKPIYRTPIEELRLCERTLRSLKTAGLVRIGLVIQCEPYDGFGLKRPGEDDRIPNFGRPSLKELEPKLRALDLSLQTKVMDHDGFFDCAEELDKLAESDAQLSNLCWHDCSPAMPDLLDEELYELFRRLSLQATHGPLPKLVANEIAKALQRVRMYDSRLVP